VFHRSEAQWQHQLFTFDNWPAGGMVTPTVAGTRPGGAIASAWAVLNYLGVEGYREKARQVVATREKLMNAIDAMDGLCTRGAPLLGLFTYGATELDPFAIWARMMKRGWFTGLCTEPRGIHLMLSPAHANVADQYLADLASSLREVRGSGESGKDVKASYA
jgi:glutamate/tyrosine decarboxylase-like PLP-dependent enzyme